MPAGRAASARRGVELSRSAAVDDPGRVELRDQTCPGRVGWKASAAEPGEGTEVRSTAPSGDPTRGRAVTPTTC